MKAFDILMKEGDRECLAYARRTNKNPVKLVTTYIRKFRDYMVWRNNGIR
jgi:hypothetical protein